MSSIFANGTDLVVLSRVEPAQIKLRWAPQNLNNFISYSKSGYKITRINQKDFSQKEFIILPYQQEHPYWEKANHSGAILLWKLFYENSKNSEFTTGLALLKCDQDSALSKAAGIYFCDSTIENNSIYEYSITVLANPKIQKKLILHTHHKTDDPEILYSLNCRKKQVLIGIEEKKYRANYSSYILERSIDSIHFEPITPTPLVQLVSSFEKNKEQLWYSDTVKENQRYFYRCVGISYFGTHHPSSIQQSCFLYPEFQSFPVIHKIEVQKEQLQIIYSFSEKEDDKLVQEWLLEQSELFSEGYHIISSTKKSNQISIPQPDSELCYFRIGAIHANGDTVYSWPEQFMFLDTIPPEVPNGLLVQVDTNGIVQLTWNENKNFDINGYKVFRRNNQDEEFVEVSKTKVQNTFFTDTISLKTLSKKIQYAVAAYDKRFNTSGLSEIFSLNKPDLIAPVPCGIKSFSEKSGIVFLEIIPSSSNDVYQIKIRRTHLYNNNVVEMLIPVSSKNFTDTILFEEILAYEIVTLDSSGNQSISKKITVKTHPVIKSNISFEGIAHRANKKIELNWKGPQKIDRLVIYKSKNGIDFTAVKTLTVNFNTWLDDELNPGNNYWYFIEFRLPNGEKQYSEKLMVVY